MDRSLGGGGADVTHTELGGSQGSSAVAFCFSESLEGLES